MRDTTPDALAVQLAAIRAMPPEERLRQALEASDLARRLLLDGMRRRFPGESDLELMERALGQQLVPPDHRPPKR
jgi:hypothetical protein